MFQISDSEKNENEASIGTKKANSEEFLTIELLDMRSMSRKILQNGFLPSAVLMIGFLSFLYALLILLCFAYYTLIRNFKNSTFLLIICLVVPIIILAFMLLLYTKLNEHKRSRRRRISAISAYDYKYEGEYGQAQGKTNRTIKDEFTSNLSLTKPLSEFVSPEESKLSERETKSAQIEAFGEPVQDSQNISASLSLGVSRNELSDQIDYIEEMGQPEELNEQKDDNLAASTMDDQRASISMSISKQSGFVHKYESERRPTREKTRTQKSSLAYPRVSVSQKPSSSCFCIGKKKTAQATISPSKNSADQLCDIFEFSNADEAKLFRPSIDYNQIAQIDQSFGSDQVFLDSDRSASAPNHSKSPSLSNDSARVQNRMSEGMLGEEFDMEDYEQAATYEEEIAEAAENQYAEEEEEQLERSQAELHML